MMKRLLLAATILAAAPVAALAQDAGLYDPAPPADSAFVRFVDASLKGDGTGSVDGAPLDLSGDGVSSFVVVKSGEHSVTYGDATASAAFDAGNYYTVVFNEAGQGPVVIKDEVLTNPAKAGLHFYNLTGEAGLSLAAPKQKVAIFENVGPGEMKFRPVGAVDVDLAVESGGKTVVDVGSVKLERRAAKSVLVVASAAGPKAVVVDNTVER
ncbi:alginate O-acetyltransferase AlgF [Chthonobacter albigriseus]|uniref:alginate O-acetyltransferase AlgF n=1 Tax=Chthonobacter albigriseus TaxID=1683161 RepID=UPI0015EEE12E|nr:alginate O-acetyltransferase AlgF [Chthonobacter albigriseus]